MRRDESHYPADWLRIAERYSRRADSMLTVQPLIQRLRKETT